MERVRYINELKYSTHYIVLNLIDYIVLLQATYLPLNNMQIHEKHIIESARYINAFIIAYFIVS